MPSTPSLPEGTFQTNPTFQRPFHSSFKRDGLGVGLRLEHDNYLRTARPELDYFEIISENFLGSSAFARQRLDRIRSDYPVILHGVGLNLLGHEPLSERYLDDLARLADLVDAPFVTDHLCWTSAENVCHHELLPVPFRADLVDYAASRAAYVQKRLGRPFGLENLSSYVKFTTSTMAEWEFFRQVAEQADCGVLLDINNVFVSSQNHGFSAETFVDQMDFSRVLQVHLAGHEVQDDGLRIDTHDAPVANEVWDLYRYAWRRGGPFPTLLEWDARIPPFETVLAELKRALEARA